MDTLKKEASSAEYFTAEDKKLTWWIFEEETSNSLKIVIQLILLASLLEMKDHGAAAARMISLVPEGSGKTSIDDEVNQLKDIIAKDSAAQVIWRDVLVEWEKEGSSVSLQALVDMALEKAETKKIIQ